MAIHTFKILSVALNIMEGAEIQRGETRILSSISTLLSPTEVDPLADQLEQLNLQLEDCRWEDSAAMLILPTREVSIRRIQFPFREQRK